jgi:hypothetical protein
MLRTLGQFSFSKGFDGSSRFNSDPETMASGSENFVITGRGENTVFKGLVSLGSAAARVMMNAGDSWCGLGSGVDSVGIGSVFRVLGAFFFIGAGTFYKDGVSTGSSASTTLSLKKVTGGVLGTTYQAGLAQPSAAVISAVAPPTGFTGKNNGVVSIKIARARSATGASSNASPTSNIVTATNQSIAVTIPLPDANGQDYWPIFGTRNAEGGTGLANHYFLQEIPESVVAAFITVSRVATNTTSIGVANGTLTSENLGWQYTSAGDVTTFVTAIGANDSYAAGQQTITLDVANGTTNTQNATFTRAISGATRTIVIEWRDADLLAELAPIRDYPPPAGIFGGVTGDVAFVDGALGDTVDVTRYARDNSLSSANTTVSTAGNAIAVSDPAKPESFPPDNYVFTGDAPTAILPGGSGVHWRFAQNSLGVIRYVGAGISYDRMWTGIGIQKQHNAVLGSGGRVYSYTGARGPVRLGTSGEPDTFFAVPVANDMAGWTAANVVLGHDSNYQFVLYMHGRTIFAFYEPLEIWCPPIITFPSATGTAIKSAVTFNGAVYIGALAATTLTPYNFNQDDGTNYTGIAKTQWQMSGEVSDVLSRLSIALRADNTTLPVSISLYTNGSSAASVTQSVTPTVTGKTHLPVLRPNVRSAKSWQVGVSIQSQGGNAGLDFLRVEGESSNITQ